MRVYRQRLVVRTVMRLWLKAVPVFCTSRRIGTKTRARYWIRDASSISLPHSTLRARRGATCERQTRSRIQRSRKMDPISVFACLAIRRSKLFNEFDRRTRHNLPRGISRRKLLYRRSCANPRLKKEPPVYVSNHCACSVEFVGPSPFAVP